MHFEQKITLECVLSFQTNLSSRRLTISGFPQMSKKLKRKIPIMKFKKAC